MKPYKHVIGHYYRKRERNLERIIVSLNENDTKPVVWNNSGVRWPLIGNLSTRYDTIDSPNNPIHGRYLAALIYPEAEVFLFQDDDKFLDVDTIERLVQAAYDTPSRFHGIEGRNLAWETATPYYYAPPARQPDSHADMVVCAYACHRRALQFGLDWILQNGVHPGRCETILFTGGRSQLVQGTTWARLPEDGVGLCYAPEHDSEIDAFLQRWPDVAEFIKAGRPA